MNQNPPNKGNQGMENPHGSSCSELLDADDAGGVQRSTLDDELASSSSN
jgi:hypothetical protein